MGAARRSRPSKTLFKRVPRKGSTSPFTKATRHIALCRVLLAQLSPGQASKQMAALQDALYEDDGSVDCRAPCKKTISRWVKQLAFEASIEARSPPGSVSRLTPQEKVFVLTWVDETKFFIQVSPPGPLEPGAPDEFALAPLPPRVLPGAAPSTRSMSPGWTPCPPSARTLVRS